MKRRALLSNGWKAPAFAGLMRWFPGLAGKGAPVDLSVFCSTNREALKVPFLMKDYVVATNAWLAVRRRQWGAVPDTGDGKPDASRLPWNDEYGPAFRILPFPKVEQYKVCGECGGREDDYCWVCENERRLPVGTVCRLPDSAGAPEWCRHFNAFYVQQLLTLPGVRFRLPLQPKENLYLASANTAPLFCQWAEGDGLLMPMVAKYAGSRLFELKIEREGA